MSRISTCHPQILVKGLDSKSSGSEHEEAGFCRRSNGTMERSKAEAAQKEALTRSRSCCPTKCEECTQSPTPLMLSPLHHQARVMGRVRIEHNRVKYGYVMLNFLKHLAILTVLSDIQGCTLCLLYLFLIYAVYRWTAALPILSVH